MNLNIYSLYFTYVFIVFNLMQNVTQESAIPSWQIVYLCSSQYIAYSYEY